MQTEEYVNFVKQLLESANIMEKRFYVIVPYYPSGVDEIPGASSLLKKKDKSPISSSFAEQKSKLEERTINIVNGLSSLGLSAAALGTEDLLELFYISYNPDSAQNQSIGGVNDIDATLISGGKS